MNVKIRALKKRQRAKLKFILALCQMIQFAIYFLISIIFKMLVAAKVDEKTIINFPTII